MTMTEQDAALVERLRQDINETDTWGRKKNWTEQRSERRKAADRIESLSAEVERLRDALWEIEMFTNGYGDVAGIVHKMAGDTRRAALDASSA